ncbi:acyltransferase [bacterium]|nr:MAG: acyltransferase [bacterium]
MLGVRPGIRRPLRRPRPSDHSGLCRPEAHPTSLLHGAVRIYPIYIAALLAAFVSWGLFKGDWNLNPSQLFGNLFMLQDYYDGKPGILVDTYKDNYPLWSLAYEWWFYLLYPAFRLRPRAGTEIGVISFVSIALYLAFPFGPFLYLGYFAVWWAGVSLAREWRDTGSLSLRGQKISLISIAAPGILFIGATLRAPRPIVINVHPALEIRHFVAGVLLIVLAVAAFRGGWHRKFKAITDPLAAIGSVSYALYVLHVPFVVSSFNRSIPQLLVRVALLVVVCILLERVLQPWLSKRLNPRSTPKIDELSPP